MRPVTKRVAWLCLLLTLLLAISFAAHRHLNSSDEAQCTVCIVAHSTSPVLGYHLPAVVLVLVLLLVQIETASTRQRLVPFALSVRPPPAL